MGALEQDRAGLEVVAVHLAPVARGISALSMVSTPLCVSESRAGTTRPLSSSVAERKTASKVCHSPAGLVTFWLGAWMPYSAPHWWLSSGPPNESRSWISYRPWKYTPLLLPFG